MLEGYNGEEITDKKKKKKNVYLIYIKKQNKNQQDIQ